MFRTIAVCFGLLAVLAAGPASAGETTIKLATLAPKGSPWHEILLDMASEWEEAGEGGLKVRIYPGGVLGDELDMMRKLSVRQIDAAMVTSIGLTQLVPDMQVFAMPMMLRSYPELDALRDAIGPDLKKRFLAKGYVVLNWGEAGWVRFFSNNPVVRPADLKKMKLFTSTGDPAVAHGWRKAGFKVVPLPATEIFSALQSGMIDAYSTTAVASLSFQWFGLAPHMLDMNWAPLVGATIIRREVWEGLPASVRARMLEAAERAGERFRERTRSFEDEAVRVMVENGLTVVTPTAEALVEWEAEFEGARQLVRSRLDDKTLVDRARQVLENYRGGLAASGAAN